MESSLEVKIVTSKDKSLEEIVISGGDNNNPTWHDYLKGFKKKYRPHMLLIREAIRENGYIGITGEQMQEKNLAFEFSDGTLFSFTWRGWGDLMQAIVNKREGYMTYYM